MPRLTPRILLAGVGALAALHLADARALGAPPPRLDERTVAVTVRCTSGQGAQARVDPDVVEIAQGDSLRWALSDDSDEASFEIVPRDHPNGRGAREWPFADASGERRGRRNAPASGRGMRADAAGRYRYDVRATCGGGGGGAGREVTLDPDSSIRAR